MQSPLPQSSQHKTKLRLWPLITTVLFFAALLWIWTNQQFIADSVRYWQYAPSSQIASLAERIELTDKGKFLFYATHPQMEGKSTFNDRCGSHEHNAAILGCYANDRIYLYDITDERLDGIKEVTAAHEMLHVVYQRMSQSERGVVNALLETEYEKMKNDEKLAERMAFYARTEPGERINELHSIIGTEVASVSTELETHYAKYLSDRAIVVGLYEDYHQEFTRLEQQKQALEAQLDTLKSDIDTATAAYNRRFATIEAEIERFKSREYTSQAQLDRDRAELERRIDAFNAERVRINTQIAQLNVLVEQYNQTITQSNELYQSIDSKLSPAPQV